MHNRRTVHILSMWGHASRLLELCLLILLGLSRLQTAHAQGASATSDDQLVCFVIRTYWGHGDVWGDGSLRTILGSLQAQTDSRWQALMVVMDNRPFPELRQIVRNMSDDRIWVYAEWINYKYAPKEGHAWNKDYHNKLYNLTDAAIRACPDNTRYVVATNGDNEYDESFVSRILEVPEDVDIVAVDFYSRYQRATAPPCERFMAGPKHAPCKTNFFRFCHTDLAANALNRARLMAENRRFGLADTGGATGDGYMAQELRDAGWKGGVWDDTTHSVQDFFGGSCISRSKFEDRMARFPTHFDVVELNLTFDSSTFTHLFGGEEQLTITCMRLTDTSQWTQGYVFGRLCADPLDYRNLPSTLPDHPWDELKNAVWPDDEESVEEERVGAGGNVEAEPAGNVNADVSSEDHAAAGMEEDADALSTHADMQESGKTEL